jgi:hypothetical protein
MGLANEATSGLLVNPPTEALVLGARLPDTILTNPGESGKLDAICPKHCYESALGDIPNALGLDEVIESLEVIGALAHHRLAESLDKRVILCELSLVSHRKLVNHTPDEEAVLPVSDIGEDASMRKSQTSLGKVVVECEEHVATQELLLLTSARMPLVHPKAEKVS